MQELVTSIGGQKVRIIADENGIQVFNYVERILDGEFSHSKDPLMVGKDESGNDVYVGIASRSNGNPLLFLCDECGVKLSACTLLELKKDGFIDVYPGVRKNYIPVNWKLNDSGQLITEM